jgi:hypothetical protein
MTTNHTTSDQKASNFFPGFSDNRGWGFESQSARAVASRSFSAHASKKDDLVPPGVTGLSYITVFRV